MMKRIFAALILALVACTAASAQGCGSSNPNCIVPDVTPATTSNSQAANTKFVQAAISANSTHFAAGGVSTGSANAQVIATVSPPVFSLTGNPTVSFTAGFSNSGATTLNVASSGVFNVLKKTPAGLVALITGDVIANQQYLATWDGTQYELQTPSQTVNAQLGQMAANTTKCNNTGGSALPIDCTVAQEIAMLGIPSSVSNADGTLTISPTTGAVVASLSNTAVTPGSYGDATHIPNFTVDQKGRLTAAGSTATTYTSSGTGATARSLQSKLNDIYSALDFGAVADGSTDNTTAFQNLVNAACGNIALIPGNNYVMTGTVTITCPVTLLGTLFDSGTTGGSANITATTTTADMFRVNSRDVTIRGLFLARQGTPTTGKGIAVGTDGVNATCSISNGSGSLSCTTSVFTSGMAVRATRVRVNGAGAGGVPLFATITGFTSGTQVTVSPTASTLVTNSPTLIADVYTDIRIEGNAIYNQNIGVHFINAARQHLIDNFILASGTSTAQAVLWEDQVSVDFGDGFMSNNTLNSQDNTLGSAFHMTSGGSPKATGNKFLGGKFGVFIDFSIGTTGGPIFSGSNSIETCSTSAIFMTAAANIQGSNFTGVHTTCGSPNVQVDNAASAVIRDAVFNAFTIAGGGGTAFDMGKCTNCIITANNIDNGAVNPAINIRSNAANNLVSSNNIIGASVTIANASTTTTIDDPIGMGFANLPTSAANGSRIFVSNGTTATSPCTGAGSGSTAFRQNGAWKCF